MGMLSLKRGSELLGYSEQAYHKWERHRAEQEMKAAQIKELVQIEIERIRGKMPKIGGEKLWFMTAQKLATEGLSLGRDKFVELYSAMGFIIKKRKKNKKRRIVVVDNER